MLRVWCGVYDTDDGESRDKATARERYDVASVAVVDGRVAPLQRRAFRYVHYIGGNDLVAYPLKTRRLARSASASSTLESGRMSENARSRLNLLRTLCEYVQQMRQFVSWHRLPADTVPKPRRSHCI